MSENLKSKIFNSFKNNKITHIQLDLNGHCNAGCWFCPVAYDGNPIRTKQPIKVDLLEKIIKNIKEEQDKKHGLISKSFPGFFTSHYNEVLMYPYLEEFFKILQKYNFTCSILSNGTPLTPNKVELLKKYSNVVTHVHLNIPIFSNAELWAERTNLNKNLFPKMLRNIRNAIDVLSPETTLTIVVNGFNVASNQFLSMGKDFPKDMDLNINNGENIQELIEAQKLFPEIEVFPNFFIQSRAGSLDHVMSVRKKNSSKKVIGCNDRINKHKDSGRPFEWLHINPLGEAFTCCNDFQMESIVGDFKNQTLSEFWGNDNHINEIINIYEGLCKKCVYAKFEE